MTARTVAFTIMISASVLAAQDVKLPVAPVRNVVDDYYATKVDDPYRYLEKQGDPNVQAWFRGEDAYARGVLSTIPGRDALRKRIHELATDSATGDVSSVQHYPGDLYVYLKRMPNESVAKLYRQTGTSGEPRLVLDPEYIKVSRGKQSKGTNAIEGFSISDDMKYVAAFIVTGGAEVDAEIRVIELASGRDTGDYVPRTPAALAPIVWLPDNHSFLCEKVRELPPDAPLSEKYRRMKMYIHRLGSEPENDVPVFGDDVIQAIKVKPDTHPILSTWPGCKYVLGAIATGLTPAKEFYIAPVAALGTKSIQWRKVAGFDDDVSDIRVAGDDLYVLTFKNAPRYKILSTDARNPDLSTAKTIVAESKQLVRYVSPSKDSLYVTTLDGGVHRTLRIPFATPLNAEYLHPPAGGAVVADNDTRLDGVILATTSYTAAPRYVRYEPGTHSFRELEFLPPGKYDKAQGVVAEEVQAPSYDGTLVPLTVVHSQQLKLDGLNPTWLIGYGAYGAPIGAFYDKAKLAWFENGGVMAVCHVRGGGEFGESWHLAGKETTKPNTWRDFIACGEYLVQKKYTSPEHLAGQGTSAGGILIGRAITERPDLFSAAVINVGILDCVRFETTANGAGNVAEFGSTKSKAGFDALFAMSSYHHVQNNTRYPAVLLATGLNDSRVEPWQTGKMVARLQAASSSGKPILLRVNKAGGHFGSTASDHEEEEADTMSFLLWQLGSPQGEPRQ